jgi:hypothetical protein
VKSNNRRLACGEKFEGRTEPREKGRRRGSFPDDVEQYPFALPLAHKRNHARDRDMSVVDW